MSSLSRAAENSTAHKLFASPKRRRSTAEGDRCREAIVACFRDFHARGVFPPTFEEIGEAIGRRSTATIHRHIGVLVKNGVIIKHRKHYILAEHSGQG